MDEMTLVVERKSIRVLGSDNGIGNETKLSLNLAVIGDSALTLVHVVMHMA